MPAVLRFGTFRGMVYPADHRPAHVHVIGQGYEAVSNLNCPNRPPDLRKSFAFSLSDPGPVVETLQLAIAGLYQQWRNIHGAY